MKIVLTKLMTISDNFSQLRMQQKRKNFRLAVEQAETA